MGSCTTNRTTNANPNNKKPNGVSVYHLQHVFLEEVTSRFNRLASIYEIEDLSQPQQNGIIRSKGQDIICPTDGRPGAAYVDCLTGEDHIGPATIMLSYGWGNTVGDIVDTLMDYCQSSQNLDPKRTYVWICCLCVNQHRVAEDKARGRSVPFETFERVFYERVTGIQRVVAVMSSWVNPVYLSRVWCIFELYAAYRNESCQLDIALPPREKKAMVKALSEGGGDQGVNVLYKTLAMTKIEDAKSSEPDDRTMILDMVERDIGFERLNSEVNRLLREWVKAGMMETVQAAEEARLSESSDYDGDMALANLSSNVANVLYKNGEHDQSLILYRKVLAIRERLLEKQDRTIASCRYHIGMVLADKGEYDLALVEFRACFEIEAYVLGRAHPDIAKTYGNIGFVLRKKEDYEGALIQFRKALRIRNQAFGEDHPQIGESLSNIGSTMRDMGDVKGALVQFRRAETIFENLPVLGSDHPIAAFVYNSIGLCLSDRGDYDEALASLRKGLEIRERLLGMDHPDTAASYHSMAILLRDMGDLDGALVEYSKALKMREKTLGTNHPDTLKTCEGIDTVKREKENANL